MRSGRLVALACGLAVFALAVPAWAHVTVSAPGAVRGGSDQLITFRVPNESAAASTVELQVQFPQSTPIASVLAQPHAGWRVSTTTAKLATPIHTDDGDITQAVSTITWRADSKATGIPVGQFDQFTVLAGQLPDAASLTFPAIQTYSDGTVVKWIEVAAPGSTTEPDHPAPVLALAAVQTNTVPLTTTLKSGGSSTGATVLAIVALVVAAGALGVTVVRTAKRS
jgi:uncharacterized protein